MEEAFTIAVARRECICQTDLLNNFPVDGRLERIDGGTGNKAVYKVKNGPNEFIFKTATCSLADKIAQEDILQEYKITSKAFDITKTINGVAKPINCLTLEKTVIKKFVVEMLFEYAGENLLNLPGAKEPNNVFNIMSSVARTMKYLERAGICHYDLKPENIVSKEGAVKIIDFGIAKAVGSRTLLKKTTRIKGHTFLYSSPEVLRNPKPCPEKVDVFCWGMTLYHLAGRKTDADLQEDFTLRMTSSDYPKFIKKIKDMQITGDDRLKWKIKALLLSVLDENPDNRPSFEQLCELLDDDRRIVKLENIRKIAEVVNMNNEATNESHQKIINNLFRASEEESKEVYNKLKVAYNVIKGGADSCNLHSVGIKNVGAKILAFALGGQTGLLSLNLGFNRIQSEGIIVLAKGLESCSTLRILILGEAISITKFVSKDPETPEDEKVSAGAALGGNIVVGASAAVSMVSKAFTATKIVSGLALVSTAGIVLGSLAAVAGGGYLVYKKFIKESPEGSLPSLGAEKVDDPNEGEQNDLGNQGTIAIANTLKNSSWERLDLSYCRISKEAIVPLVEAANTCGTLKFISIKGNPELAGRKCSFRSGIIPEY